MPAKNKNIFQLVVLILTVALTACNLPTGAPVTNGIAPSNNVAAAVAPTATFTSVAPSAPSPTSTEACKPTVTTSVVANIRSGPGQVYNIIGSIPQGGSADVAGKSTDGTWWYIVFPAGAGGFAWVSNTVTTPNCIPSTLASIVAPPAPVAPAATAVPTQVSVAQPAPSATTVPSGNGPHLLYPVNPGIFLIKSPTPTFVLKPVKPIFVNPIIIQQP